MVSLSRIPVMLFQTLQPYFEPDCFPVSLDKPRSTDYSKH